MDIFPTAYFGGIYYFKELYQSGESRIESHEHFLKQTCRTRCTILSANGVHRLSVPVIRPNGSKTVISEVLISQKEKWQKDHWKSIESAYASSPYFESYDLEIKDLIYQKEENLLIYNTNITKEIYRLLDLNCTIQNTDEFEHTTKGKDFRAFDFEQSIEMKSYTQVFAEKEHFISNLSILDLLFCQGPFARNWILNS